jgi:hypothetical protein
MAAPNLLDLRERVAAQMARPVRKEVSAFAHMLSAEVGAEAALFYGSNLRTGSLEGVLDFYLLLPGPQIEKVWPKVSYREWEFEGQTLRAKVATMSLEQFAKAARGTSRDTTIWARFVQPCALVFVRGDAAQNAVQDALCDAAKTAARLAAALGPESGPAQDYWSALFRETYKAEFRVEKPGRETSILSANEAHFDGLLPLAWAMDGISFEEPQTGVFRPQLTLEKRGEILGWWKPRRRLGKALNIARLAKATTTFQGAADYAAWKLERHSGIALEVTPFREKHPLLSMPGAALELWLAKRR